VNCATELWMVWAKSLLKEFREVVEKNINVIAQKAK